MHAWKRPREIVSYLFICHCRALLPLTDLCEPLALRLPSGTTLHLNMGPEYAARVVSNHSVCDEVFVIIAGSRDELD